MSMATRELVTINAAKAVVKILRPLGIMCGLQGELACEVYGLPQRVPKTVEVMVFWPSGVFLQIEHLKRTIVLNSGRPSHFFMDNPTSSSPNLCYSDASIPPTRKNTCNVHLTYFPNAPLELLRSINNFTIPPLSFLLLQKLKAWAVSRSFAERGHPQTDVEDIQRLLELFAEYPFEGIHFDQELFESSKAQVHEYFSTFPDHASTWQMLGYGDTPSPEIVHNLARSEPQPEASFPPESETDTLLLTETLDSPDYSGLTRIQMVCLAGKMTIDVLRGLGCDSAIFGSLACFLYGNQRSPNDVDILILPSDGVIVPMEDIKSAIVELDPVHFFLISARDPQARYRILYFRLADGPGRLTPRTSCKVDLVAPRTMHLPPLPPDLIHWDEGLPLIPFSLLLLQKLQSWSDHWKSPDELKRLRQSTDVGDLRSLFELSEIETLQSPSTWIDRRVFSMEFEALSRDRVKQYCSLFPDFADGWKSLGFETEQMINFDPYSFSTL